MEQPGERSVQQREPVFNVPAVVIATLAILVVVHLGVRVIDRQTANDLLGALAFIPARYSGYADSLPGGLFSAYYSPVTYGLVHADWLHLGFNSAWLLAFGSILARRIGAFRFVLFAVAATIAAAMTYLALHWGQLNPVIGASGGVAGLMGGVMRILFPAMERGESWKLRERPSDIRALTLIETLTNRKVQTATTAFVAINLLAIIGFGSPGGSGPVAWEAHIGGYVFGLAAFGLFDRGYRPENPTVPNFEID